TCSRPRFLPELEPRSSHQLLSRLLILMRMPASAKRSSGGPTSPQPEVREWWSSPLSSSRNQGVASSQGSNAEDRSTCASSTGLNTTSRETLSASVIAARLLSSDRSPYANLD